MYNAGRMSAKFFATLGSTANIVGVFLLSVEAIKLENFRKLRERFLVPLHHTVLPGDVRFVDRKPTSAEERATRRALLHFFVSHFGGGLIGCLLAVAVLRITGLSRGVVIFALAAHMSLGTRIAALVAVLLFSVILPTLVLVFGKRSERIFVGLVILSLFPLNLVVMAVGEALHYTAIHASSLCIRLLDAIDANTPTGTIGIIGFGFMLLGFLSELAAAWL